MTWFTRIAPSVVQSLEHIAYIQGTNFVICNVLALPTCISKLVKQLSLSKIKKKRGRSCLFLKRNYAYLSVWQRTYIHYNSRKCMLLTASCKIVSASNITEESTVILKPRTVNQAPTWIFFKCRHKNREISLEYPFPMRELKEPILRDLEALHSCTVW